MTTKSKRVTLNVPMNRVEGDLEVRVELEDGVVAEARCSGTMFRGFENILVGRGPLDGIVITPRICGICSTSHLAAAARALDSVAGVQPPPDGIRVRNVALLTEQVQSDLRQTFLMFAPDLVNRRWSSQPLHGEAVRRYAPFEGTTALEAVTVPGRAMEVVAILGGQWPHASFMVPGGITSVPSQNDLLQCRLLLRELREWYERRVLGCSVERFKALRSAGELEAWLEEEPHRESELGFLWRYGRAIGLDRTGRGPGAFVSYGGLDLPEGSEVAASDVTAAGFVGEGEEPLPLDQRQVVEHVACSWFEDDEPRHPMQGRTRPYATGEEGQRYSWAKAPRYGDRPAETGPLAEMMVGRVPLFVDLIARDGPSTLLRQLARLTRPARMLPVMERWLAEAQGDGTFYKPCGEITEGEGCGLVQAPRGALGHWVRIADGAIAHYQIITPTAWNASPRDDAGTPGPMEQALVGTAVQDPEDPVELGHVVRSFDPCLVCTVHAVRAGRTVGVLRTGSAR